MKKGYKNTEIGVIPEDWEVVELGDLLAFKNGLNKEKEYFGFGIPIVNYMDVYANAGLTYKDIKGKVSLSSDEIRNYSAKLSDVFFTRTSETQDEVGISTVLLENVKNCVFSGFILRGRPKTNKLNIFYSKYCFRVNYVRKQIISTSSYTTRALTNGRLLSEIILPLPPIKEQQAIATVLSDTDTLLSHLKTLISKKKAIKQGAMQELLTGKKRLKGFSGDWEVKKLGDTIETVIDNRGKTPPLSINGIPLIEVNSIFKQGKTPNYKLVTKFVNEDTYNSWFRAHPEAGDILIVTVGSAGTTSFYDKKIGCIAQNLISLRINIFNNSEFIYYLTKTRLFMDKVKSVLMGGVQPSLKVPHINNFEFSFPKKQEQQAIAQILTDMDTEIEALESQLQKTQNLKQGLMQELLTGKIRLVTPEIENKINIAAEPRASYGK